MDARQLILRADQIRQEQELTQAEWCRRAGFDQFGKLVSNTFNRGNCKVSVLLQLLKPLGYEIKIVKMEGKHDEKGNDSDHGGADDHGGGSGGNTAVRYDEDAERPDQAGKAVPGDCRV